MSDELALVEEPAPELPLVSLAPDEIPPVQTGGAAWAAARDLLVAGHGPIAVDAERASGYRYGQRAYLVQLNRRGATTVLVDPLGVPDLTDLAQAIGDEEWIIHAASQDLTCLAELGLVPRRLFDTELAGRLLGLERVSLGAMVERNLGLRLAKEHSAADWSTRPLPPAWLAYAALDVVLLIDLRDSLATELQAAGKAQWAEQEFAYALTVPPPPPRAEPWRRLSGIHVVKSRGQLAEARALWLARDEVARQRDIAPGRVLPDRAIIDAVKQQPASLDALVKLPVYSGPRMRKQGARWWSAIAQGRSLPDTDLPTSHGPVGDGPPTSVSRWAEKDPAAAARITSARLVLAELAGAHSVQVEVLLEPALLRRLCWDLPAGATEPEGCAEALSDRGARPWQVELVSEPLSQALRSVPSADAQA